MNAKEKRLARVLRPMGKKKNKEFQELKKQLAKANETIEFVLDNKSKVSSYKLFDYLGQYLKEYKEKSGE